MTLEELNALHAKKQVYACPNCGRECLSHCWHGEEVDAEPMPVEEAIKKLQDETEFYDAEISAMQHEMRRYKALRDS